MIKRGRRIGFDELAFFNRQLASMARLNLPFPDGLRTLSEEVESPVFQGLVEDVHDDLSQGFSLSDALAKHTDVFSELYLGIIRAGEEAGDLASALEGLANYSESMLFLRHRVRAALAYPIFAILLTGAITYFMFTTLVPKFGDVFRSLDIELPAMTKLYLGVTTSLNDNGILVLGSILVVILGVLLMRRYDAGARRLRQFTLGLPFFGRLLRQVLLLRFCETLRALLKSNVSLVPALALTGKTLGDNLARQTVEDMRAAAEEGRRVSDVLKRNSLFPKTFVWKFALAEEQGTLEATLGDLSRYLEEELRSITSRFSALLEPMLIVVMSVLVGSMVISVFLPIFKLQEKLAG